MKQMISTVALMALFAMVGLSDRGADVVYAATDTHVRVSSAMPSRVLVSTGTTQRVDNWNNGVQGTIIDPRVSVCLQNLDSADDIYVGYTTRVGTNTANATNALEVGTKVTPDTILCIGATRNLVIRAMCVDAAGEAGCVASVVQYAKE